MPAHLGRDLADHRPDVRARQAGRTRGLPDLPLSINRYGYFETCYFTFSYSPVYEDSGRVGGVLATFVETTHTVMAERRQAFQLALADILRRETGACAAAGAPGATSAAMRPAPPPSTRGRQHAAQAAVIREQWRNGEADRRTPGRVVPLEMLAFGRRPLLRGETGARPMSARTPRIPAPRLARKASAPASPCR
jgi:hypothetical protein